MWCYRNTGTLVSECETNLYSRHNLIIQLKNCILTFISPHVTYMLAVIQADCPRPHVIRIQLFYMIAYSSILIYIVVLLQ